MKSGATTLRGRSKREIFIAVVARHAVPLQIGFPSKINGPSRLISGRAVLILQMAGQFHVAKRSRGNIEKTRLRARGISAVGGDDSSASGSRTLLSRP